MNKKQKRKYNLKKNLKRKVKEKKEYGLDFFAKKITKINEGKPSICLSADFFNIFAFYYT